MTIREDKGLSVVKDLNLSFGIYLRNRHDVLVSCSKPKNQPDKLVIFARISGHPLASRCQ